MTYPPKALRLIPVFSAGFHAALLVSPVLADVPPDATRPAPSGVTNWWDAPASAPQPERQPAIPRQNTGLSNTGLSNTGSSNSEYPNNQLTDWVVANAMAARSRAVLLRAESELGTTVRRVQERFEHSKDFSDAVMAEKHAYAEYDAARHKALARLANNAQYHAISLLRDELGDKIAIRRTAKDVTKDELLALARLKLDYASDARAIEVSALGSDEALKASHDRMVEASRKVADLKARFDDSVHDNPEVLVARHNLEDARVSMIEAQALAQGAGIASAYAVNYAYYLHRNDNGGTFGPYGPNGNYGSYYSPYWGR